MCANPVPPSTQTVAGAGDAWLFGWDQTPGIVSVWANHEGRAVVWRRVDGRVLHSRERFTPWLFATSLQDLTHLGASLVSETELAERDGLAWYRMLDGAPGAYRYLLFARSGRALERRILMGAEQRLGRTIRSLYDLEDAYYRVGPVEQYLMLTGRVYFRGLAYDDLHRLQLDLETTALDPQRGRIFMVAVRDNRGLATTLDAPAPADEADLIAGLCGLICERDPDVIENHNLFGFDLPFLVARADALGIPLALGRVGGPTLLERYNEMPGGSGYAQPRARYRVAGRELVDTLDAVRRHDFVTRDMPSHRLKDVARYFGIAATDRVYLAGADVFATYRQNPALVRRYAFDDVAEVDGLSRRLLGAPFALAGMAPRPYERVVSAGPAMGILEPMLVRAYLHAGAALPNRVTNQASGPHAGGAVHLFATGVAEQVVKADIASLYPSLMRTFQIGPACDRLGVLLYLVSRLTDLRLEHKAAARAAAPGSLEAGHHDSMQAAMKLIINAAYGYMGAGTMALFADSYAADEVTRRGREMLAHVVEELRQRGMALIEADTDGVFFAVPPGWTESQERDLVAAVSATLPPRIRLEYEGRYRAMFSHEVKNYALLKYGGELILRGVALRSSRSEPFGEQFLRAALRHTMTGDIAGLRQVYLETVDALRSRALPAAALAARVRLSKASDVYQSTRTTQREAQYEALLAAGRTHWTPGERVRYYRKKGGTYVWLPDDDGDAADHQREDENVARREESSPLLDRATLEDARDYDVEHYLQVLVSSYAVRLRKAFAPQDFAQLFRLDAQLGLFDTPVEQIEPCWIRCRRREEAD
ncbi:MAG: hypothetical protein MI924_31510 [Chloroflexales bacterium]|nr:hypothetical protein [Chloroflexales bacterium]